jgi:hypothetical protein
MTVRRPDRLAIAIPALEADDVDLRMAAEQSEQLSADVAGRADDPDANAVAGARPAVRRDRSSRLEPRAHRRARTLTGGRLEVETGIGWTAVMAA